MVAQPQPGESLIDGTKRISTDPDERPTSKRGYPIVAHGATVWCPHCSETHVADYRDESTDVGLDIPGGHKRRNHYTCPETGYRFAAKHGSARHMTVDLDSYTGEQ